MTGMGLLAVRNMWAINANAVDIQSNWLPSVRVLGALRAATISSRSTMREYILEKTLLGKGEVDKKLAQLSESLNSKGADCVMPLSRSL